MPHKVAVLDFVDEVSTAVEDRRRLQRGALRRRTAAVGDMFDGEGFVRGVAAQGRDARRRERCSSSAPAASARRSPPRSPPPAPREIALYDVGAAAADALAERLDGALSRARGLRPASTIPQGYDIVVNATPLGMNPGDPLPIDVDAAFARRPLSARS